MATNSPVVDGRVDVFHRMNGPVGVGNTFVNPVSSSGTLMRLLQPASSTGRAASHRRARRFSRRSDAVSVAITCARTAWPRRERAARRARPRQIDRDRRAECRRRSRHHRNDAIGQRIASSTLLVIMTVVTGRRLRARVAPGPAAASRVSARRARRRVRPETAPGLGRERPRDGHALTHAARQLSRPTVVGIAEADLLERCAGPHQLLIAGQIGNAASTASRTFSAP